MYEYTLKVHDKVFLCREIETTEEKEKRATNKRREGFLFLLPF